MVFVQAPENEHTRMEHFHFVFNVWLKEKLKIGDFVPSLKMQSAGRGLESGNAGLDLLKKGVSGVNLVVKI